MRRTLKIEAFDNLYGGRSVFPEPRDKGKDKRRRARIERSILRRMTNNEIKTEV